MKYTREDLLHKYFDTSKYPFLKELILIFALYMFYIYSENSVLFLFLKYIGILVILRYILSVLTETKDERDKRQFLLNINVVIFSCILLLMNEYGILKTWSMLTYILIASYSILVISTKEHYTSDVIITVLLVLGLHKSLIQLN